MAHLPRNTALLTALTTAWLAVAVIFAGVFVIEEADHDCTGADCPICLEILIAQRLIEAFGRLGAAAFVALFIASAGAFIKPHTFFHAMKPVALKVKLNC